jgi:hypothetical protein
MIRLAQYTKELERLAQLEMDEAADREFERVCTEHIGIDFGDLFDADVTRIETIVPSPGIAAGVCKSLGYDIVISGTQTLTHWWGFSVLIVAKSEGIVPADPALRAKRRVAIEAEDRRRRDGIADPADRRADRGDDFRPIWCNSGQKPVRRGRR